MSYDKIDRIAQGFGFAGPILKGWLADSRYSQDQVAYLLGTKPETFALLLAQDEPVAPVITTNSAE
jgi:hypothetical protein